MKLSKGKRLKSVLRAGDQPFIRAVHSLVVWVSIGLTWGTRLEDGACVCLRVMPWVGPRNAVLSMGISVASFFAVSDNLLTAAVCRMRPVGYHN